MILLVHEAWESIQRITITILHPEEPIGAEHEQHMVSSHAIDFKRRAAKIICGSDAEFQLTNEHFEFIRSQVIRTLVTCPKVSV